MCTNVACAAPGSFEIFSSVTVATQHETTLRCEPQRTSIDPPSPGARTAIAPTQRVRSRQRALHVFA